jgi:DNA polymerase I
MAQKRLDEFHPKNITSQKAEPSLPFMESIEKEKKAAASMFEAPQELPPSYLVSITYDGAKGKALVKLYEPTSKRVYFWHDTTGHKPYLLTNLSPIELEKLTRVMSHPGLERFEQVEKYDPLLDRQVFLTKVVAKDPLAIGGRPKGCLRDIIPEEFASIGGSDTLPAKVWESAIKYYQCYVYDRSLALGMLYKIEKGELVPVQHEASEEMVKKIYEVFKDETEEELEFIERWARLLEYPAPHFRRVALDIEVFSPVRTRVPDPREAAYPVICVSFVNSEGSKRVLLLKREGIREGLEKLPADVTLEYFDSEEKLIRTVFEALWEYPFVITFNGDDFDLRYLAHRALNLGFRKSEIPIEVGRRVCLVKYGVHIDLYKFFYNRSIQIYAFSNRYRDVTLDDVGRALIGLTKVELSKPLSELTYTELAQYCLRDAEIAYKLTSFDDDLTMKLILVLARISRMPMEDVSRQGVSRWIRNFLHFEHRRRNMLIPNADDILAMKGKTATKAIIKGKKYKGAIVVEPVPGVHFNVAVMDFPSLYPSIIKVWNLGYQTILCSHEECKSNRVPDTPHWVCTKKRALESLLIGSLRDLRVKWYKPKSKDKTLSKELRSWYDVIQSAVKVILNASYGVFGAETFDLYCPPVAEATAAIGRHSITLIVNKAKELGIQVIYGDTDSVFLKNPSEEQINSLVKWSEKELKMGLDVDKVYRYAVFSSRKKNYLGIYQDGNVDVKGLTGKKKHIPVFIKEAFEEMKNALGKVKSPAEFEQAKKEIKRIILDHYMQLKRREWKSLDELAFHVVLGEALEHYTKTTPQHVKAAEQLKKQGIELKAGDLISFVKISKEPHVKPVELATDNEIDVDKYIGYLQSTFEQVLDALGLEFNELIGLTKLERFM